jgi:hypothetical protein
MLDQAGTTPDLDLLLSPGDAAEYLCSTSWTRRDGRTERCQLWVVLHRRHGLWTHGYRVVRGPRPGHVTVYLECAREGDRRAELRARLGAASAPGGHPTGGDAPAAAARPG